MSTYDVTFYPVVTEPTIYYVASFVIDLSINGVDLYQQVIDTYKSHVDLLYYAVGLDKTLMHGEHPHYHVTIVFPSTRMRNGKPFKVSKGWIQDVREQNWHYGQSLRVKISEWDGTLKPVGYATKEDEILVCELTDKENAAYQAAREYYNAKKKHELEDYEKEQKKKEHTKLLKDEVREYLVLNVKDSLDELRDFMERPQMREKYGYCDCTEYDAVRVCLERYQIENNKHFQTFELNKYVFDYYRYVRGFTAVEMYFLRVNNNIR